MLIEYMN